MKYNHKFLGVLIIFGIIMLSLIVVQGSIAFGMVKDTHKIAILKGNNLIFKSGCISCHSFKKGIRIDRIVSLADWGDKKLSVKQTERDIRACKADIYCRQILTDKQVKYIAVYLNSLKSFK